MQVTGAKATEVTEACALPVPNTCKTVAVPEHAHLAHLSSCYGSVTQSTFMPPLSSKPACSGPAD